MKLDLELVNCLSSECGFHSVLLSTENEKYLFNIGEGLQRLSMEHKLRLGKKLRTVFLTNGDMTGGLPGFILTLSDIIQGKSKIIQAQEKNRSNAALPSGLTVHGPVGIQQYLHATRHFLCRPDFPIRGNGFLSGNNGKCANTFKGEEVIISAVVLENNYPDCASSNKKITGIKRTIEDVHMDDKPRDSPAMESHLNQIQETPNMAINNIKHTEQKMRKIENRTFNNAVISYIVETPPLRGQFQVKKAKALGIPPGPMYAALHRGESVTLPDGRVVEASECVEGNKPGSICLIMDIPNDNYLDVLLESTGNRLLFEQKSSQVQVVLHMAPVEILEHPKYSSWIKTYFGANHVQHILLNHPLCPSRSVFRASSRLNNIFHGISPDYFTRPPFEGISSKRQINLFNSNTVIGESLMKYSMIPTKSQQAQLNVSRCFTNLPEDMHILEKVQQSKEENSQLDETVDEGSHDGELSAKVTFLGTGSAIPSKYRNVTGIYVQPIYPDHDAKENRNAMLLDAGEGCLGQLWRSCGNEKELNFQSKIDGVKCVWISHNHADHHLGLIRLLTQRTLVQNDPLLVIGPLPLQYWLKEYNAIDSRVNGKYIFANNEWFKDDNDERATPFLDILRTQFGINSFRTVPVEHCHLSSAVVFTFGNANGQFKFVYSGDCRPSLELAEMGVNADILIHEATFENEMSEEAKKKSHSTIQEAIDIGVLMKAKQTILFHFSQRYPKFPPDVMMIEGNKNVNVAFDLMTVDVKRTLPKLASLIPSYSIALNMLGETNDLED